MIKEFEIEPKVGFIKSPWRVPPAPEQPCDFDLEEWLPKQAAEGRIRFYELGRHSSAPVVVLTDEVDERLKGIFEALASQWKQETWFVSSIKKRISHPAFLKIIGLGAPALPLILEELRREPDYWSYALEAITREDPVPHAENLQQLRDAWLAWGEAHGY
jgi:hypothetical protein